jgi:hypothetical protein
MQSSFLANILSVSLIALVNSSVAVSVAALLFARVDPRLLSVRNHDPVDGHFGDRLGWLAF